MGVVFLFQSVGTSLNCQVFSDVNVCLLLPVCGRPHLFSLPGWKQISTRKLCVSALPLSLSHKLFPSQVEFNAPQLIIDHCGVLSFDWRAILRTNLHEDKQIEKVLNFAWKQTLSSRRRWQNVTAMPRTNHLTGVFQLKRLYFHLFLASWSFLLTLWYASHSPFEQRRLAKDWEIRSTEQPCSSSNTDLDQHMPAWQFTCHRRWLGASSVSLLEAISVQNVSSGVELGTGAGGRDTKLFQSLTFLQDTKKRWGKGLR